MLRARGGAPSPETADRTAVRQPASIAAGAVAVALATNLVRRARVAP